MGGIRRGQWQRWHTKLTVEDCLQLDVNKLKRDGFLAPWWSGTLAWTNTNTGQEVATVGARVEPVDDDCMIFWLRYRWRETDDINLPIVLQATYPNYGGRRWWFTCPLTTGGVVCDRRVGKLYLHGAYFGCRHCHDLTYTSCQECHQGERMLRQLERVYGKGFLGRQGREYARRMH